MAIKISQAVWKAQESQTGEGLGKNYEWKPLNHNKDVQDAIRRGVCDDPGINCEDPGTKYLEWPDGLNDIDPLPKGDCWREWKWWDDYIWGDFLGEGSIFGEYDRGISEYRDISPQIHYEREDN